MCQVLRLHVRGRVLDVGCGQMPFQTYLEGQVETYDGLDVERRCERTNYLGDAQDMKAIGNGAYDTVVSFSVLEHLPQPQQALREMCRVCRPGGTVVVDVPHLSRYHELPHDYYRFTEHGLSHLAEAAGLEVVEVQPLGGLAAFLGHQVSTVLVCSFWRIPVLKWGVFAANYLLVVCPTIWLDRLLKTIDVFPSSLVGVFRRPLD